MLGIVILNYNTPLDALKCIKLIEETFSGQYKIYLVDNRSKDNSIEIFTTTEYKSDVVLLRAESNAGYSAGNNIGIEKALDDSCEEILIVNPDVEFKNGSIQGLQAALNSSNKIGLASPKVLDIEGNLSRFCKKKPLTFWQYMFSKPPLHWIDIFKISKLHIDYNYDEQLIFKGVVSGCCMLFKAEVFKSIGLLDDNIFLFYEEDVLSYKLKKAGYDICIEPSAEVIHAHSKSIGGDTSVFAQFYFETSALYFLKKYQRTNRLFFCFASILSKLFYKRIIKKRGGDKADYIKLKEKIREIAKLK